MTFSCRIANGLFFGVILFFVLTGCFPHAIHLPKKFSTIKEVYPSGEVFDNLDIIPADSYKKAVFEAPYEDVFYFAKMSATQAMFNIESDDKSTGLIFAMKATQEPGVWNFSACGSPRNDKRYFYAIKVNETGPSTTEVMIIAKAQGASCYAGGASVGTAVGSTLGVFNKDEAVAYATVHWSTNIQDLLQYMTIIRSKMIEGGY